ncbi:MAG: hypothetical protein WC349_01900 [Patescibacteria group bacterium]|jgi:hypothetical protein
MPDIKSEIGAEKSFSSSEKPLGKENLKHKLEHATEKEKTSHFEKIKEDVANKIDLSELNSKAPAVGQTAIMVDPAAKRQKQIENILAKDLEKIYLNLTPEKKAEFKKTGEQTASKINQLLNKAKVNIGEILRLIKKWLSIIPGVNKYFLEQEAKIKADEVIKIKEQYYK